MNGIAFDTLAAAKALRAAGFEDRQAEAVTGVVRHAVGADRDTLATKADVAALRADLDTGLAGLRADLDTGLARMRADLDTGLAASRADLDTLRADIYRALWAQGAGLVAVMAALIAAFKLFG